MKTTYIVLLNWRGWQDTIDCLQSLFAMQEPGFRVVVCDNDSGDGSLTHIAAWARGERDARRSNHPRLQRLLAGDNARPQYTLLDRAAAERGHVDPAARLILVQNGANLGFAAGNNVGLRLALQQEDMDAVWILNNDTLVEPDCLASMRRCLSKSGDRAACGSMIHFFDQPDVIQAIGGNRFNKITGVAGRSEGRYLPESAIESNRDFAEQLDYISGCSMLLPRVFLETVGLMNEEYFLYYEEIDWFTRAAGRFPVRVAGDAVLYHREGSAIGSPGWKRAASTLSDYHMLRSRLLFMRRFYPQNLPWCYLGACLDLGKRILRGQFANARTVLGTLLGRKWGLPA